MKVVKHSTKFINKAKSKTASGLFDVLTDYLKKKEESSEEDMEDLDIIRVSSILHRQEASIRQTILSPYYLLITTTTSKYCIISYIQVR